MGSFDTDLFIVGAGPAGIATAIAARQQGFRALVADSADPPIDKSCGEGLLPDGVAALRELGVQIPAGSGRFRGIRFFDENAVAEGQFPDGTGFGIRRTTLWDMLFSRAVEIGVDFRFHSRVTGIEANAVRMDRESFRTRWIVGADGFRSQVRRWAGLQGGADEQPTRFGFRRHFHIEHPPDHVEVYWRDGFQAFVTPVGPREVAVALTTGIAGFRLDDALALLPELTRRLGDPTSSVRGALTGNFKAPAVHRGNVALVGDASGAVDSITGEGLRLSFRQAQHLASAMAIQNLRAYSEAHRRLAWRPRLMANFLLWMAHHAKARHLVVRMLQSHPAVFRMMLTTPAGLAPPLPAPARKGVL